MNKKYSGLFLVICLMFSSMSFAQKSSKEKNSQHNKISLGFQINQHHTDFGFGGRINSPYFAKGFLALRLSGNVKYHSRLNWRKSGQFNLGLVTVGKKLGNGIRLYAVSGVNALVAENNENNYVLFPGGYGLFGFEFFMTENAGKSPVSFYIEMGGNGTNANINKLKEEDINVPITNGFVMQTGFNYYF